LNSCRPIARATLAILASLAVGGPAARAAPRAGLEGVPAYEHIVIIMEENKDFKQIAEGPDAPHIQALSKAYGQATDFHGETHPSEGNYVALLGGDTFGIHDDDPFYCKPGTTDPTCGMAKYEANYPDHTTATPHVGDQLTARGLTWKAYYESLPAPGSLAIIAGDPRYPTGDRKVPIYASKHSGFVNFASTQNDPDRAAHLVGFDRLDADLAAGALPNFALIVPNQCNEMHGVYGAGIPADCQTVPGLIRRGDAVVADLVKRLQATRAWKSRRNMAIVISFDEGDQKDRSGCCGVTPGAPSNYGGGHIPTIVITNHGPHGLNDPTPYSHYSLLRTIEDAFGISEHLGHAAETDKGVRPMTALFGGRSSARPPR